MINFKSVTASAFLLLLTSTSYSQLFSKKYLRKNSDAPITVYGDTTTYSRGLYVDSSFIYLGSANGAVYRYNTADTSSKLIMKFPNIKEIRDLEFSNGLIYAMQSGDKGVLVKISSRGPTGFIELPEWNGVFLDALDFNGEVGFLMGDPVDGQFTLFHTKNGGAKWERCAGAVEAFSGEAAFAASGSNVQVLNDSTYIFASGGMKSNFYKSKDSGKSWSKVELPYYPGESIGPYSMCFSDEMNGVVVGGDYLQPSIKMNTTFYTYDGGETWFNTENPPNGYRSCVYFVNGFYYACGRTGIDYSEDGENWFPFAEGKFFAMTTINNQLIATIPNGRFQTFNLVEE